MYPWEYITNGVDYNGVPEQMRINKPCQELGAMSKSKEPKPLIIGGIEFTKELNEQRAEARRLAMIAYRELQAPLIEELRAVGCPYSSLDDLRETGTPYEYAVPILLDWLIRLRSSDHSEALRLRGSIVRTLSVPWARPMAIPHLLNEFRIFPEIYPERTYHQHDFLWVVGNALLVLTDPKFADDYLAIATNKVYGWSRGQVVLALAKLKHPQVLPSLLELLDDPDVQMDAAGALAKLKAAEALPKLSALRDHLAATVTKDHRWKVKDVEKAIGQIQRAQERAAAKKK